MRVENATASYIASLEDKGLFGSAKQSAVKAAGGAKPAVPVWVQLQVTE
jgi:hypothetical protein